jgi:hypothetical protein
MFCTSPGNANAIFPERGCNGKKYFNRTIYAAATHIEVHDRTASSLAIKTFQIRR